MAGSCDRSITMIKAYFERKGCVQRKLYEKVLKASDQSDVVWFVSSAVVRRPISA